MAASGLSMWESLLCFSSVSFQHTSISSTSVFPPPHYKTELWLPSRHADVSDAVRTGCKRNFLSLLVVSMTREFSSLCSTYTAPTFGTTNLASLGDLNLRQRGQVRIWNNASPERKRRRNFAWLVSMDVCKSCRQPATPAHTSYMPKSWSNCVEWRESFCLRWISLNNKYIGNILTCLFINKQGL